ncbi:MAG: hypothetical protein ACOVKO_08440 [Elstera sp.]
MRGKLSLKIVLMLQLVFGAALILTALLNYFKFEKAVTNVIASRFVVTVNGLQGDVENAMNLGLSLAELRDLQQLIEREERSDDQILAIEIADTSGTILFSTDKSRIDTPLPEDWLRTMTRSEGGIWQETLKGNPVLGATLRNTFGQVAGGVMLSYAKSAISQRTAAVRPGLTAAAVVAILACSLLTVAGVWLVFRNIIAGFRAGETYVVEALSGGDIDKAPKPTGALGDDIVSIVETLRNADQELKQAAEKA